MKTKSLFQLLGLFVLGLYLASCKSDSEKATLQVRLMDGPGDYEAVFIDIKEVRVHTSETAGENEGGWIKLNNINVGVFDLLELTNGLDTLLASVELPAGKISQIRLILGNNNSLKINGQTIPLNTPSAMQSGLKLKINTTLQAGITYTILLDFDAARSIVKAGNSGNYNLKPVIKAITQALNGAIKGKITPLEANPAIYAIQGNDTIRTTYADENGHFLLKSLENGTYTVAFDPATGYQPKTVGSVSVTTGNVTDMGTVQIVQ